MILFSLSLSLFNPYVYVSLLFLSSGVGQAHQLQPGAGGERGDGVWEDHSGHPVHPGRPHQQGTGFGVSCHLHAASPHQCHFSTSKTCVFVQRLSSLVVFL